MSLQPETPLWRKGSGLSFIGGQTSFSALKNCVTNQRKSDFENSETKYFTKLLTNSQKYVRISLRNKMFHKLQAKQKLMRGYYEKER